MAVNISNVLVEEGHDVMLIVSRSKGALLQKVRPSVIVKVLGKKSFLHFPAFLMFTKIIKEFQPDIIHAHSTSIYWAVITKFIVKGKFKILYHDHYGMSENLSERKITILKLFSLKIDMIIAVNEKLRIYNINNLAVKESRIVYIKNFPYLMEIEKFNQHDTVVILCLANMRQQKDHLTLVTAFSILVNQLCQQNVKLVLAGNTYHDGYNFEIQKLIKSSGLQNKVEIIGVVNNIEVLLAKSDIGVLSSVSEGLPVSLLEYGLAALPVVVTNVGQCAEVLGNGQFGKLVEPKDALGIANAIFDYLKNPKEATFKGNQFRNHVLENYGSGKFLQSYFDLLKIDG